MTAGRSPGSRWGLTPPNPERQEGIPLPDQEARRLKEIFRRALAKVRQDVVEQLIEEFAKEEQSMTTIADTTRQSDRFHASQAAVPQPPAEPQDRAPGLPPSENPPSPDTPAPEPTPLESPRSPR